MTDSTPATAARNPRCSLNGCVREQGIGTWTTVQVNTLQAITVPVCEEHWKVLRDVPR